MVVDKDYSLVVSQAAMEDAELVVSQVDLVVLPVDDSQAV